MHSDLDQAQRDEMMFKFKSGQIDVLVATDILSRGIDIDDITMVINYDVPNDAEDYVHRIGRTARADRDGIAITLVSDDDIYNFQQIENFLEKEIEKVSLPEDIGKGPEYKSINKSRKNTSAKARRKKARDQQSHKDKKIRNNKRGNQKQSTRNEITEKKSQNLTVHTDDKRKQNAENTSKNNRNNRKPSSNVVDKKQQNKVQNGNSIENNKVGNKEKNNNSTSKSAKGKKEEKKQRFKNENTTVESNIKRKQKTETKKERRSKETNKLQQSTKYEIKDDMTKKKKSENKFKSLIKKPLKWLSKFGKK